MAPNTSTSIVQNASASVLPTYSKFFFDSNGKTIAPVVSRFAMLNDDFYESYAQINIKEVVSVVSRIQKWVDQGISFDLIFDLNKRVKAKEIYDAIFDIWQKGCKTIYYIRSVQKQSTLECESCTL